MSLTALSERAFYSRGYLSKVETGQRPVSMQLAQRCDQALSAGGALARLASEPAGLQETPHRPAQLPAAIMDFTGRDAAMSALDAAGRTHPVTVITGPPGVGKTVLAVHWAQLAAGRFPDGCLFANLRGYDPADAAADPAEILDRFLRTLGTRSGSIPADLESRAVLLRTLMRDMRMLIVLDNAVSADQVRPLLPGPGDCRVLVTSRSHLSGLTTREGAGRVVLDPMPPPEALTLLAGILGAERVAAEPDAAAVVAHSCDYLPLALRIAADRIQSRPSRKLAVLAAQLTTSSDRLDLLATDDGSAAVRAALAGSYRLLPARAARLFRLLGLYHGQDISLPATGALAGLTLPEARRAAETLVGASLLTETSLDRYAFHDLTQLYAAECAAAEETDASWAAAMTRLGTWYLHTADAADLLFGVARRRRDLGLAAEYCQPLVLDSYAQSLAWFDGELGNLPVVTRHAAEAGLHTLAWQLPHIAWGYFTLRHPCTEWIAACKTGLASAQLSRDQQGEIMMLHSLSAAYYEAGRFAEAAECGERTLPMIRRLGNQYGESASLANLAQIYKMMKRTDEAVACAQRSLPLARAAGNDGAVVTALQSLALIYQEQGSAQEAIACFREALDTCRRTNCRYGEASILSDIGALSLMLGQYEEAIKLLSSALVAHRTLGYRHDEATTLLRLGEVHSKTGQARAARTARTAALAICDDLGDPRAAELRELLGQG